MQKRKDLKRPLGVELNHGRAGESATGGESGGARRPLVVWGKHEKKNILGGRVGYCVRGGTESDRQRCSDREKKYRDASNMVGKREFGVHNIES